MQQPLLMAVALLVGPAIWAAVLRPQLCVLLVVGVLYANLAVVAVKVHGAPQALGMLVPLPLALPMIHYMMIRGEPIIITRTLPWIVVFMAFQAVSMLCSPDPKSAWPTMRTALVEGLILYLVVTNAIRGQQVIKSVAWCLLAAAVLMAGISCLQWVTSSYDNDFFGMAQVGEGPGVAIETGRGRLHQRRVCGPIGEQNRYAQVLLMVVPIGFCLFQANRKVWIRGLAIGATVVVLAGCMLTFSRGAFLALAFIAVVMIALRMLKPAHLGFGLIIVVLAFIVSPQLRARVASIGETITSVKATHVEEDTDGAVKGRLTGMLAATRVFGEHPLIGVGPGRFNSYARSHSREGGLRAFETSREVHCLYLELAAENGLIGLAAFGMIALVSLRRLGQARSIFAKQNNTHMHLIVTGFMLALLAYFASAAFLHMSYARYFWLILACADISSLQAFVLPKSSEATTNV